MSFPRLALSGERESGKSKVLTLLRPTAWNALLLLTPTPAVLFRLVSEFKPTLLPGAYAHPWTDQLHGLGARRVTAFTDCADCLEAPAWPIEVVAVRSKRVMVAGDRGTWVRYGGRPLCLPCARRRAAE